MKKVTALVPMSEPASWSTALELSFYTPDRQAAIEFVQSLLGQDDVCAGRIIRAWRARLHGHRTPAWWVGQIYQRDDSALAIPARRQLVKLNVDLVLRRRPIPPGWYTTLRARWHNGGSV